MEVLLETYSPAITALGVVGGLLLVQLLVADIAGIRAGHTPGAEVASDHSSFLFRAVRAHANTNESAAAFVALVVFSVAVSASPAWVNGACVVYLIGRIGHMCSYYADLRILRSLFFAVSLLSLFGLLLAGWTKWLSL